MTVTLNTAISRYKSNSGAKMYGGYKMISPNQY